MSFTDIAGQYLQNRWDQATQPFDDPEGYMSDRFGNAKPKSTTISYDDQGQPATVTTKHDIAQPQAETPVAPVAPENIPQPVAQAPVASPGMMPEPVTPVAPQQQRFEPYQVAGVGQTPPPPQGAGAVAPAIPDQTNAETARLLRQEASAQGVPTAPVAPGAPQQQAPVPQQTRSMAAPAETQPVVAPNPLESIGKEQDLPKRYAGFQKMVMDPSLDEGTRKMAATGMMETLQRQQAEAKAMRELQTASPNDLARIIKKDSEEGSFVKYFLASRLGLQELASKEADKLGYTNTRTSEQLPTGEKYYVERRKDGTVVGAMDTNGNYVPQDVLARISTESLPSKGAKAEVGVQTVVNQKTGQIGKVVTQQFGSQTRTFIESEGKMYPANGNEWKPQTEVTQLNVMQQKLMERLKYVEPTKRMEVAAKFDQENGTNFAGQLKQDMPEFFGAPAATPGNRPVAPVAPGAVAPAAAEEPAGGAPTFRDPSIKIISGQRATSEQQQLWDQSVAAGTPGRLPNGNPVARPGTSLHETGNAIDVDSKKLTRAGRQELAAAGYYQPLPQQDPNHWERARPTGVRPGASMAEIESGRKQREREQTSALNVTEAEQKEFVKHKDTVLDQAEAGRKVAQTTRSQTADLMNDPVIIGIMNGSGTQYAKAGKLIREMASGAYAGDGDNGKRLADDIRKLGLTGPQTDALDRYAQQNTLINAATLKANTGGGQISNAEQNMNKQANMTNIGDLTPFAALNGLGRRQFQGDLTQERQALLSSGRFGTRTQFENEWSKIQDQRIKQYESIYKSRLDLIKPYAEAASKNPNDAAAQQRYRDAAVHSFRVYPTPDFNPQNGKWEYRTKESKRAAMNAVVGGL